MNQMTKIAISCVAILLSAGGFFLSLNQAAQSHSRYVVAPPLSPEDNTLTDLLQKTSPGPELDALLQEINEAHRPKYKKITDLDKETKLEDKYTLIIQRPDGSLEATLVRPEKLDKELEKLDPNDLIYNILPPDSWWVTSAKNEQIQAQIASADSAPRWPSGIPVFLPLIQQHDNSASIQSSDYQVTLESVEVPPDYTASPDNKSED